MIDAKKLKNYLQDLNQEFYHDSWTHPRTLFLLSLLIEEFKYKSFLEIGSWLGSVPVMLQNISNHLHISQLEKFVLIDNFEDHKITLPYNGTIVNAQQLHQHVTQKLLHTEVEIYENISNVVGSFDIMHFDSVKWKTELITQFEQIYKSANLNAVFLFDDYIAEWPDVIYCVDCIQQKYNLEVVATFGPKIYLTNGQQKNNILNFCRARQDLVDSLLNIRYTIKHGYVISSGPDLMI